MRLKVYAAESHCAQKSLRLNGYAQKSLRLNGYAQKSASKCPCATTAGYPWNPLLLQIMLQPWLLSWRWSWSWTPLRDSMQRQRVCSIKWRVGPLAGHWTDTALHAGEGNVGVLAEALCRIFCQAAPSSGGQDILDPLDVSHSQTWRWLHVSRITVRVVRDEDVVPASPELGPTAAAHLWLLSRGWKLRRPHATFPTQNPPFKTVAFTAAFLHIRSPPGTVISTVLGG